MDLGGCYQAALFFHKYSNYAGQEKRKTETLQY